jgi:thiamine biosynthesis lipoprotein
MASTVMVHVAAPPEREAAVRPHVESALAVFGAVERACTRFDPRSPLMRANASPTEWHHVPQLCFDALAEAHRAYELTDGRFDPRVHDDLVRLGYARSMHSGVPDMVRDTPATHRRAPLPAWRPQFEAATSLVRLGDRPVDLGGIGKGLTVRWAARILRQLDVGFLVEAGGDCYASGSLPDEGPWRIAIEDPSGDGSASDLPIAVLGVADHAVATSSVRVRRWRLGGRVVHHLIDPCTGAPGGEGLQAVTVTHRDPAMAEVWSKILFLAGSDGIAAAADEGGLAALWVSDDGAVGCSAAMAGFVVWLAR